MPKKIYLFIYLWKVDFKEKSKKYFFRKNDE